jgi:hypothetical protein
MITECRRPIAARIDQALVDPARHQVGALDRREHDAAVGEQLAHRGRVGLQAAGSGCAAVGGGLGEHVGDVRGRRTQRSPRHGIA